MNPIKVACYTKSGCSVKSDSLKLKLTIEQILEIPWENFIRKELGNLFYPLGDFYYMLYFEVFINGNYEFPPMDYFHDDYLLTDEQFQFLKLKFS